GDLLAPGRNATAIASFRNSRESASLAVVGRDQLRDIRSQVSRRWNEYLRYGQARCLAVPIRAFDLEEHILSRAALPEAGPESRDYAGWIGGFRRFRKLDALVQGRNDQIRRAQGLELDDAEGEGPMRESLHRLSNHDEKALAQISDRFPFEA